MVDALMGRMSGDGAGPRDDLRALMHELKHAVIERGRDPAAGADRVGAITAILRRAAADIRALP